MFFSSPIWDSVFFVSYCLFTLVHIILSVLMLLVFLNQQEFFRECYDFVRYLAFATFVLLFDDLVLIILFIKKQKVRAICILGIMNFSVMVWTFIQHYNPPMSCPGNYYWSLKLNGYFSSAIVLVSSFTFACYNHESLVIETAREGGDISNHVSEPVTVGEVSLV